MDQRDLLTHYDDDFLWGQRLGDHLALQAVERVPREPTSRTSSATRGLARSAP